MKKLVLLAALTLVAGACSKSNDSKPNDDKVVPKITHKAEECPSINGEFVTQGGDLDENGEPIPLNAAFKTETIENGISLQDNERQWTINGKSHPFEANGVKLEYVGLCDQKSIIINVFQNGELKGTVTLKLNDKGQLLKNVESRHESIPSTQEVWDPKN